MRVYNVQTDQSLIYIYQNVPKVRMYTDRGYDYPHILMEFTTEITYRRYFTNLYIPKQIER